MTPRRALAAAVLVATATAVVLATSTPALAAEAPPVSQGRGFFLSGLAAGTDLATVASLQDAVAVNEGGPTVTSSNPLGATVLGDLTLPIGGQTIPIGQGLRFGVLHQFAQANPDGSATASSGAIGGDGAIQTSGADGSGSMTLDLQALAAGSGLPAGQLAALGNATLTAGAL
ncbi:choice-of-anchor G family protein, partial [Jatrophihabitans sp. YIM 134969]